MSKEKKPNVVVFFYAKDFEGAWGSEVETPDWRVDADSVRGLVEWISLTDC